MHSSQNTLPNQQGEVLVAIMNNPLDFAIARDEHWYRIPVTSAKKWLKKRFPPQWLAFYQTKVFGAEKYAVNYYASVIDVHEVYRWELFPDQPHNEKSNKCYYQLILEPLKQLPKPIFSRRLRRIMFISTTWQKFINAVEINDLYDTSPLEDKLWAKLKYHQIQAERQEFVTIKKKNYALDFAIYCATGKIDVEANGDTYHLKKENVFYDKERDNTLATAGWHVLRFPTHQIREEIDSYCLPTIVETVNRLGGIDEGRILPRKISLDDSDDIGHQLGLFDTL